MKDGIHYIAGDWPGRLSIAARPRCGDWLEDEVRSWKRSGVQAVVSLLTPVEEAELELEEEEEFASSEGMEFAAYPIADRGIPDSAQTFLRLIDRVCLQLSEGKSVLVHCRQGIGRAGMVAIGCLLDAGLTVDAAITQVSSSRGRPVPETGEQRRWIEDLAGSFYRRAA